MSSMLTVWLHRSIPGKSDLLRLVVSHLCKIFLMPSPNLATGLGTKKRCNLQYIQINCGLQVLLRSSVAQLVPSKEDQMRLSSEL